jgi:hypothetical protein
MDISLGAEERNRGESLISKKFTCVMSNSEEVTIWMSNRDAVFFRISKFLGQSQGNHIRPVVFIHYPHSNPHPSQMGRVWVENNYPLKK